MFWELNCKSWAKHISKHLKICLFICGLCIIEYEVKETPLTYAGVNSEQKFEDNHPGYFFYFVFGCVRGNIDL